MDEARENYIYTFDGDLTGEKLIADIQKYVDEVRSMGVDYVIVVGHLGEYEDVTEVWSAPFIAARTRGIDAFIDGHSHEVTPELKIKNADGKEVIITQSGTKLAHIGQVTIGTDGKISSKLIDSSNGKDEEIDIAIQKIKGMFEDTLKAYQGYTSFDLRAMDDEGTWMLRDAETNLCNLIADAYFDAASMTKTGKADIAFINAGGIRTNIMTGEITFGDALSVLPFGNTLCIAEVSGQTILDELEVGARLAPQRSGGLLHASGLTYTIDARIPTPVRMDKSSMLGSIEEGERRVKDVKVNGEAIDPEKVYKVISVNYVLFEKGDGHIFNGAKLIEPDFAVDSDVLGRYIKKLEIIPEVYENIGGQGRLTVIQ
jgi:2',3'-cyclic-nucleotide 2'-phosphodiesterase (5'-nucleotidase family)